MRCYKVVRRVGNCGGKERLVSMFARGAAAVEYEIGKLTVAPGWLAKKGNGIICYDTLENAVKDSYCRKIVLECAVLGPQRELPKFCRIDQLEMGTYAIYEHQKWAEGTVVFDGVIPMRIVPEKEVSAARR